MKFRFFLFLAVLCAPITAFAAQPTPKPTAVPAPSPGIERISWAVQNSGAMPKNMFIGIIILLAAAVITIIFAMKGKGDSK